MRKTIDYKVDNGKLLRLDFEKKENKIVFVNFSGDFFVYPETAIGLVESAFLGEIEEVKKRLDAVIEKHKIVIVGFSSDDIELLFKSLDLF